MAGWAGASLILLAYLLLSLGRVTGQSALYQGMNVAGAAGFIPKTARKAMLEEALETVLDGRVRVSAPARRGERRRS